MKQQPYYVMDYYDREVIEKIIDKYNFKPMDAVRSFLTSKTHRMLQDVEYGMLEFAVADIFEMWEAEMITGNPANSIPLRAE